MAAPSFHRPKVGPSPICMSGKGMLQTSNQLLSVIFLEVYFLAEKNICPSDFLWINEKHLKENLINSLCYRWHQIRHSLGSEVTGWGGEGNENWPSSHACQVAWGQSVPINMNEDWRHSAPCMIKPKPKAAFLIKIALPSSFPKGTLIFKNFLSLAVVSNWALLTSLPIIQRESEMCSQQLRDSGHFKGSPDLLPLATPHFLSYHPSSFQPQLHLLFPMKAWERDRQVHVHHHLLHHSSGLRVCRDTCGTPMSHTVQACEWERQDATCLEESEGSSLSPLLLTLFYQASTQVEAELCLLM